jgi:acetyl-CoA C-acetyltransferase
LRPADEEARMTSAVDPRSPCIIGVARRTWHPDDAPDGAPEPLAMWEEMARAAVADARTTATDLAGQLESIDVVYSQSWQYDDPAGRLAERVGATPARRAYSGIGGSVPQMLAVDVADHITRGDLDLALIVGAEALATVRRLKKAGQEPPWSFRPAEVPRFPMELELHPSEISHAVFQAFLTFALFDNARRAHLGRGLDDHRTRMGRLLASMTEVAAASPHAWFPVVRSAAEIATATPENRMVAYPYTKLMTAIMDVDMAAGLLMASAAKADALGVPDEARVYLRGWGYDEDPAHVADHRDLWRSPAMTAASRSALGGAGIGMDEVAHLDLYSCFASSVCFALDALGLSEDDERGVTQTGGLPYHGGPGSNYMTHSLAAMVETLRGDPGSFGLVSGVGMHMQKHTFGLWSTDPGRVAAPSRPEKREAASTIVPSPEGSATVATYSVLHGRDGEPTSSLLVCDLPGGGRCYAKLDADRSTFEDVETSELIGRTVTLTPKDGVNLAHIG